jgi:hypothetical protein
MTRLALAGIVCVLVLVVAGIPMSLSFASPGDQERPTAPAGGLFSLNMPPHFMYSFDEFWFGTGEYNEQEWPTDVIPRGDITLIQGLMPGYRIPMRSDVFRLDTGQAVEPADRFNHLNIKGTTRRTDGENFEAQFHMGAPPAQPPVEYKISVDLRISYQLKRCLLCMALQEWLRPTPAYAQGADRFSGPGFQEDVVIYVRWEGPGRATLRARTRSGDRAIPGTVKVEGKMVAFVVRWATLNELGVTRAAIRAIMGVVGAGMFDRVPTEGAIQLGVTRGSELRVVSRFTLAGDGPPDLFYYDTNGNGMIDAAARDINRNGQIEYMRGEGPFSYVGTDGRLQEFSAVEQRVNGRRRVFLVQNAQMGHLTIADDKNGDGRIGPDEFAGYFLPRR